jgi:hypothetical protein
LARGAPGSRLWRRRPSRSTPRTPRACRPDPHNSGLRRSVR